MRLRKTLIVVAACSGLLPVAACTRTSDGTVVMQQPPSMSAMMPGWAKPRFLRPQPSPAAATYDPPSETARVAPSNASQRIARVRPVRAGVRVNSSAKLSCVNRTVAGGGRVKVVCQ